MAEKSTSKNQQFLQQFERQRLNKPCNRIIDLRGKVAGECQAYTFGGKTHYLDDRGYLLARQLLERFHGKYTLGVYESILKALKSLKQADSHPDTEKENSSTTEFQLIPFDRLLHRKETRIVFTTPIEITLQDVQYNASTIDITTSAIRIALKRSYTLEQNDTVAVKFIDFSRSAPSGLLSDVNYQIININHDERHSFALLIRDRNDNVEISNWFDQWTEEHNTIENLDLDSELFNLTSHFYQRLYSHLLTSPLLWLSHNHDKNPIQAFHLSANNQHVLESLQNEHSKPNLALLPIKSIMETGVNHLLVSVKIKGKIRCITVPCNDANLVAKAIKWLQQHERASVLFLQIHQQSIDIKEFTEMIASISVKDEKASLKLVNQLESITKNIVITDISNSCLKLDPAISISDEEVQSFTVIEQDIKQQPIAKALTHYIKRAEQRFIIRTPIHLHANGKSFKLTTSDASSKGLSFQAPADLTLSRNTHVTIDFDRWQTQTSQVNLTGIPFIIKNNYSDSEQITVGLARDSLASSQKVNDFFDGIIERNKNDLSENNDDILSSQEARIYSLLLNQQLTNIPFFIGMNENNERVLNTVATSVANQAQSLEDLWQALNSEVTFLSELVKDKSRQTNKPINFGLYCYQSTADTWQISTEHTFSSPAQKALFINRALKAQSYRFFHCALTSVPANYFDNEKDLNQQLSVLRTSSPHKVKRIKEALHSVFAMGELTDITNIIKACYQ